jgi:biotin synthase
MTNPRCGASTPRHDWTTDEAETLLAAPFADLVHRAQTLHREHFPGNTVQLATLMNIKSGGCPEDCAYCPQSAHHGASGQALASLEEVLGAARAAQASGATRFCMGAAWRSPRDRDLQRVTAMVRAVKALGMETCVTLGMLTDAQARTLKQAGLDYYNHNIDTSPEFYGTIITTRRLDDRLDTLRTVRDAGIKVCCGGIIGMGETVRDRASMLATLACQPEHPQSVPINMLVKTPDIPLAAMADADNFDLVRTIAAARIMMPASVVRLSAGRLRLADAWQALCFLAGANSIFYGERLLTTGNPDTDADRALLARLGMRVAVAGE